jgi:signal transduction histidine kinase
MKLQQTPLLILLFIDFSVFGQVSAKHIRNFGPEVTRSGEVSLSVAVDQKGVPYFGTEKGVLIFEGGRWKIIPLTDESGVRALEYDTVRHRLWVGGAGTFGYLTCDSKSQYRYVSISDSIIQHHSFKQVWQILVEKGKVTFMTNEAHFEWSDTGIIWKDIKVSFIFSVDGTKYYSQKNGALSVEENGVLEDIWDQFRIREGVYFITAQDSINHLLFTPYNGVFRYNRHTKKVTPFSSPLSGFLKEHPFYDASRMNDSLIVMGTWSDGIVIANVQGQLIDRISTTNGIVSAGVSDVQLDTFGKLWAATDYGISVIDFKSAWPGKIGTSQKKLAYPLQVIVDDDSTIFLQCTKQVITLRQKPRKILFTLAAAGVDQPVSGEIEVKLVGVDKEWVPLDNLEKEYKLLGNGSYEFRIKLKAEPESAARANIVLQIREPWYQPMVNVWEYLIISLVFVALLIFAFTYRLRVSKRVLSRMVAEKTRAIERHEKELLEMNESLRQANEELDILLYRSSHDLISPVKSIKGLLNLIKLVPADQAMYLGMMEDRIARLEHILLELNSYVKNVKGEPTLVKVHFRELCEEVWRELEFMDAAVKLEMQMQVEDKLALECDRGRLKMIVTNLVGNSVKYADLKKEKPFISVEAIYEEDHFALRVSDNGQGIRPEHQTRLFEMFYRASEGSNGLGLGLFLVKKIVESLKGTITINSQYGEGTLVEVRLPHTK